MEKLKKPLLAREIVFNIRSGVNFKYRKFERLLEREFERDVKEVAITNKDRLCKISMISMNSNLVSRWRSCFQVRAQKQLKNSQKICSPFLLSLWKDIMGREQQRIGEGG
jgi:predicted site-specific integrase-resolvase